MFLISRFLQAYFDLVLRGIAWCWAKTINVIYFSVFEQNIMGNSKNPNVFHVLEISNNISVSETVVAISSYSSTLRYQLRASTEFGDVETFF